MLSPKLLIITLLVGLLPAVSGCSQSQNSPSEPPPIITPAPGQPVFAPYGLVIPLPEGIEPTGKSGEMPGIGYTAIYTAPALTEAEAIDHFNTVMPALGFESQGKIGPNQTYVKTPYTFRVQLPGDGFLILTMLKSGD
jgi:hypothetical protein